jgi:hypothetical protein
VKNLRFFKREHDNNMININLLKQDDKDVIAEVTGGNVD